MKVLVSRRSFSLRLDACLVLYCCIIFLGLRGCSARIITQETSDTKVEEVHDGLTISSLGDTSEELKNVDEVSAVNEKRLRRVTETLEEVKVKDATVNSDVGNDKIVKEPQEKYTQKGTQKGFKRLVKIPVRRLKRSSQNVNEEIVQTADKNKKSEVNQYVEQNKGIDVEGIRRLDIDVEEEDKKESHEISKDIVRSAISEDSEKPAEIKVNINIKDIEHGRSQEVENEPNVADIKLSDRIVTENDGTKSIENPEVILKNSEEVSNSAENLKLSSNRAENFSRLQSLKSQALELQEKIRNSTFLQSLKNQVSEILPDIPKFTENQFLDMLETIMSKKNLHQSEEINADSLKSSGLNDNQIKIIKCAQQLVAPKERQSFFDNMTECIRGLNVINCLRIFVYPIIVENMPEVLSQGLSNLPIEINVADLFQGNRDRTKSPRQVPVIGFYTNAPDPDSIIFNILMEGLLKNPPNENLPSFIDAKNESLSKFLTCNRLQLLQMTEKYLPEDTRQSYSDEMLSCVQRFEFFSCIKYFSWPAIKQFYSALPQFPLSDTYLASLIYPNYPLIIYPGYASGFSHLPEVIEAGPARITPETYIMAVFKKTLSEYPRIVTPPTPIQLDLILKNHAITQEQISTIHLAEQLLPVNLRAEYVSRTVQCIAQFDYYNCVKYFTWPVVRQFNPLEQLPNWQEFLNNLNIPDIPPLSNFLNFISQFQLFPFQLPQFGLPPQFSNFSLPDFSNLFPFQPTTTTPKPPAENPSDNTTGTKKNDNTLESKIYVILKNVRNTMGATPLSPPTYTNRKVFLFPLMTEEQSKIFALAESIMPPIAREQLITSIYFCLNDRNEFSTCAKTVIWPSIRSYVKGLPEFPAENDNSFMQQQDGTSIPFFAGGDNFFIMREIEKFFFEGREDAMSYIIRSMQLYPSESLNTLKLLEILRSIQFNTPEFLTVQLIRYPRTPQFLSILTENQENIVHAVESIIPQDVRQKFCNDMIFCAQKNKFPVCSRNVIFPSIYPYFQKTLSAPYYNIMPDKKNYSKLNKMDSSRINPVTIEPKINAEKQGENIVITTDRKFTTNYPNPELVIFSMLRKIQISAEALPDFPKLSIANTPEFQQTYTTRQAHILTVAEAILPEEYRKGFLENMYKCNQYDSFLNCTRTILFPVMTKAYPDFPTFPDFENELNRSNMLLVIDNLNKSSSSPMSYTSKKMLPSMEILYKFVQEDKSNMLRILIDKLPDSLYYDLYIKMSQCTQYSNSISCGHDIIYPTLKQYYDVPGFNIDDYYPITTQPPIHSTNEQPLIDYELFCENMGFNCNLIPLGSRYAQGFSNSNISLRSSEISYIPFGKLADGNRIFKQIQDVWNPNITPSEQIKSAFLRMKINRQQII